MKIIILFIIYIFIIIISVIYTIYTPKYFSYGEKYLYDKTLYNKKNKEKLESIFKERLNIYSKQINHDKMNYDEWFENISKDYIIKLENDYIYYFFIYEKVPESEDMIINLAYDKTLYKDTTSRFDFKQYIHISKDRFSETRFDVSDEIAYNMFCYSEIGEIRDMSFYWIDPYYYNVAVKNAYFTKWKTRDGREGIIGIGFDSYNLTYESSYKVIDNIHLLEFCISSLLLFSISFIIFSINANKFSKIESIIFLILSHIYIIYFINKTDHISSNDGELSKISDINSSILNISFLSAINIYIIDSISKKNSTLFKETSYVFCITTVFLLLACYKSTDQNSINQVTGARYTNQYLYNLSVILNFLIIINYLVYSSINIKKLIFV